MLYMQKKDNIKVKNFNYVILDTDGGADDIQAIVLIDHFVKKTGKKLLGITCCNGNVDIKGVIDNTLVTLAVCKSQYPVYFGVDFSMAGENLKDYFFGKDGMGQQRQNYLNKFKVNYDLVQKQKAYKFIADSAIKYKGQVALVCIGPLTNIALAYHYNNKIADCFSNISIMGTSPHLVGMHNFYVSQFNIALDPEAAYCVFKKFNNIIVSNFDETCFAISYKDTQQQFLNEATDKSNLVKDIFDYQYKKRVPVYPQVIDPLAVISLFRPEVVKLGRYVRLNVHVKGHRTRGCTVVDYFSPESHNYNCFLVSELDVDIINEEISNSYLD